MIEIYLLEQLCAFEECATLSRAAQMLHHLSAGADPFDAKAGGTDGRLAV